MYVSRCIAMTAGTRALLNSSSPQLAWKLLPIAVRLLLIGSFEMEMVQLETELACSAEQQKKTEGDRDHWTAYYRRVIEDKVR